MSQIIEALIIAGFALLAALLAVVRVAQLQRPQSGPTTTVLRPGDAWASRWEPPRPIPPRPRPGDGGGRFVGRPAHAPPAGSWPRAKRPHVRLSEHIGDVMRRAAAWVMWRRRR